MAARAAVAACFVWAATATASTGSAVRLVDGTPVELGSLATGEQAIIDRRSGPLEFAGREIVLDNAIAIAGYASEAAYLVIIDGSARFGTQRIARGRMLLLPPFGAAPVVERFDAARLEAALTPTARAAAPQAKAALRRLSDVQGMGKFFGRYQRTQFNVAASGEAASERTRRTLVGGRAVRAIRFGSNAAPTAIENRVIASLANGLIARDVASVAQLLDPTPFGGAAMGVEGGDARTVFARALVERRDWGRQLGGVVVARGGAPNQWLLAGPAGLTIVTLRPTPDFAFVGTITAEERP